MRTFSGKSADTVWRGVARAIIDRQGTHNIGSRKGGTVELTHGAMQLTNPRNRWITSRKPTMNVALAIAEVIQILSCDDDVSFLAHWFPDYPKFIGGGKHAAGAYGVRLRKQFGFDQLSRAANALNANRESRQAVLSIWNPTVDLPHSSGAPRSGDVPCNVLSCLRVVDDQLHWLQTCRSNDIFRGLPYNFVQFTYLQEVIAGWIGVDVGIYSHTVSSLHAYTTALREFSITPRASKQPESLDIRLPLRDARVAWRDLNRLAHELINRPNSLRPRVPPKRLASSLGPLESMYWILVAENARRRRWREEAIIAARLCEDKALQHMWRRRLVRVSTHS